MATNEKMTMRMFLNGVLAVDGLAEDLVSYAKMELAKLDERNENKRNSLTPTQAQNELLKAKFVEMADAETAYVASTVAEMLNVTTQKASALMRALKADGVVTEGEGKGKGKDGKGKVKTYTLTGVEFVPKTTEVSEATK